ncbi:MAG: alkaline phosphatase family protein [Muribaculaceae bacterium]|nr:alkaline phosphatase family protein [Muribaculaceae bacterium]
MNRLLKSVVVGLAGIQGITLAAESRPKLVVGIIVDQLRTDYLEDLKGMLGAGGFQRLIDQGLYLKDVDFVVPPTDAAASTAIIQTGTFPRYNGISGNKIYNPSSKTLIPVFNDEAYIGNFTSETYSPAALRVATITDALSVEDKGKSKIHSIAPDAAQAIVLAGHTGQSAFWVNDETGRWSSTTYYPNPPSVLQNRNYNNPLVARLDTIKWTPLRKGEPYPFVNSAEIKDGFKYSFSRSDRDLFSQYKSSPYVNSDITEAAIDYLTELNIGKNEGQTDVLNIAYSLSPFTLAGAEYRYELEDAYLRLDRDLEKLFNTLDKTAGKENVLVYLVSTGYFEEPEIDNTEYRIPGGTFSVKRATSLLNAYLAAKYGNGAFVDHYAEGKLFLDKNTLEEKDLNLTNVAQEARDFLVKMSGVADAYTLADLTGATLPKLEAQRLAIDPKTSADIFLEFNPGWSVVDDTRFPATKLTEKSTAYKTPGFILGKDIEKKVVEEPVKATAIAPTIAGALRIRSPNSSESKSIL